MGHHRPLQPPRHLLPHPPPPRSSRTTRSSNTALTVALTIAPDDAAAMGCRDEAATSRRQRRPGCRQSDHRQSQSRSCARFDPPPSLQRDLRTICDQQAFARHIHFVTSIVGSNGALICRHLVDQRDQVLRQSVMLARELDPQTVTYFLADRGTTGAVESNGIANIWTGHVGFPVISPRWAPTARRSTLVSERSPPGLGLCHY